MLYQQIEQLVRAHIEATWREATAALAHAFSSPPATARVSAALEPKQAGGRRGASTELAALSDPLNEVVVAQPGETMEGAGARASTRCMHV